MAQRGRPPKDRQNPEDALHLQEPKDRVPKDKKPKVKLTGEDGNAFSIAARVRRALNEAGFVKEAVEFQHESMKQESYRDFLVFVSLFVDVE